MPDSPVIARLLAEAFPGAAVTDCRAVEGGRNNRLFRVETTAGTLAAKRYFSGGDWDRLAAETRFLRFCEDNAVRRTPRFLAANPAENLALFEWIPGTALKPGDPTAANTVTAAAFLKALREAGEGSETMPPARDACLRLEDFFRSPRQRLADLAAALEQARPTPIMRDAADFLRARLEPRWRDIERAARAKAAKNGYDPDRLFGKELCFVSPSDFGFHNAMRLPEGDLCFVDFEYAGRDSLVKAIADFVCQPSVPPAAGSLARMIDAGADSEERRERLSRLLGITLPVVRIKFCCIVLNDFKTPDGARRQFALGDETAARLEGQLRKAREYFDTFCDVNNPWDNQHPCS